MSVYQIKGVWRYRFMINGERYTKALPHCRNRTEAKAAEDKAKVKARAGELDNPAEAIKVADFINNQFLQWSKASHAPAWHYNVKQAYLPPMLEFFAGKTFAQVTAFEVERYKLHRKATPARGKKNDAGEWETKPRAAASVNRELAVLSSIFALAVKAEIINANPCEQVKGLVEDNQRERQLDRNEEARLFEALQARHAIKNDSLWPLVQMAINTGLRKSELLKLRCDEVDLLKGEIRKATSKNKRRRRVALNSIAREVLRVALAGNSSEWVFPNPATGKPYTDIKKSWKAVCDASGLVDFHWHDLRHTFASRLVEAGADPAQVRDLLGHAKLETTSRYTHTTAKGRANVVESLTDWRKRA